MSASPFDPGLTLNTAPKGALGASAPALSPSSAQAPNSPFSAALTVSGAPQIAAPSTGQLARTAWNQGGQTLQIQPGAILGIPGAINTHIPLPQWLEHSLTFQGRGLHDVGQGIENAGRWIGDKLTGQPYQAPAQTGADRIMGAAERQHPGYNYGVKLPTELLASVPLGEGAGAAAGGMMDAAGLTAGEGAPLLQRALAALPRSMAMGAAYGVQQPQGSPGVNAGFGAASGPLLEGAARLGGSALGFGRDAAQALYQKVRPPQLGQSDIDSFIAKQLADRSLPLAVTPRETVPGVTLPTAVHSANPDLLALQSAERTGNIGQRFNELVKSNNDAIVNGLRNNLAPNADSPAISDVAHQMLLDAQERARGVVKATYAPFDEAKGGVYLERGSIQKALREAHAGLLPAHQEMLPAKVREVMEADHPLHLMTDVEDLGARLSDAIGAAPRGTPAARALMTMRDALNKGVEDAPLANQVEPGALTYDPARAPMPGRNMAESDPSQDSILQFLAKHPKGISSAEGEAQGLDPADMRGSSARVGIRRAFRQGGMGFDEAAQALHQAGYPVADEHGNYDPNVLLNHIDSELRGRPVYSAANTRQVSEVAHEAATASAPTRAGPGPSDLAALIERAGQTSPELARAAVDAWTDDEPETLARVGSLLREGLAPKGAPDATELWKNAKAANSAFRERFPQGTARDSEARGWLAKRLRGQMEPTKFLSEALTTRGRAEALLDAFEHPEEREQMRQLMRNHYTNRLLWATKQLAPGDSDLNADALSRARRNMGPVEETVYTPHERALLDRHVEAARLNGQIVQRLHMGSSETAALQHYQQAAGNHYAAEAVKHLASTVHPVLGAVLHMLPAAADNAANQGAIEQRLLSALLDPDVYNQVASARPAGQSPLAALLSKAPAALYGAAGRAGAFTLPRSLGPPFSR